MVTRYAEAHDLDADALWQSVHRQTGWGKSTDADAGDRRVDLYEYMGFFRQSGGLDIFAPALA
ncbi:MAG TPA: hypothetical protein VG269_17370 [Tepidisphaeraceae bacterium]|nr:hypothetical protein [Tepidisphaeraceae bacterium]